MPEPDFKMPTIYSTEQSPFGDFSRPYVPTSTGMNFGLPTVKTQQPSMLSRILNGSAQSSPLTLGGTGDFNPWANRQQLGPVPTLNTVDLDGAAGVFSQLAAMGGAVLGAIGANDNDTEAEFKPVFATAGNDSPMGDPIIIAGMVAAAGLVLYLVMKK